MCNGRKKESVARKIKFVIINRHSHGYGTALGSRKMGMATGGKVGIWPGLAGVVVGNFG